MLNVSQKKTASLFNRSMSHVVGKDGTCAAIAALSGGLATMRSQKQSQTVSDDPVQQFKQEFHECADATGTKERE